MHFNNTFLSPPITVEFFSLFSSDVTTRSIPDYNLYKKMNTSQPKVYRQSIRDSRPAKGWINDSEGLFTNHEEDYLESLLQHFERETTLETSIVTVDSTMIKEIQ